mmetsp:Transcript_66242/g.186541  ORF Transcript_66242/g.186541 Transcript_66242/m.186541 type:complete len:163 (+) Transcript_66242:66-554(+)
MGQASVCQSADCQAAECHMPCCNTSPASDTVMVDLSMIRISPAVDDEGPQAYAVPMLELLDEQPIWCELSKKPRDADGLPLQISDDVKSEASPWCAAGDTPTPTPTTVAEAKEGSGDGKGGNVRRTAAPPPAGLWKRRRFARRRGAGAASVVRCLPRCSSRR